MKRQILPLLAALMVAGCAGTGPTASEQFASCAAARDAVARAGNEGLLVGHQRTYDDRFCYFGFGLPYAIFSVERVIGGQHCDLGYTCIETSSGVGGGG